MKHIAWLSFLAGLTAGACSQANLDAIIGDSKPDAAADVAPDAALDAAPDVVPDGAPEVVSDVGPDGITEVAPDTVAVTCPSPVLKAGDTTETVTVAGTSRSFVLHVPATYDGSQPVPLVLDFHAIGGTGMLELRTSPFPAKTDPEGAIIAFPNGAAGPLGSAWNLGPCCVDDVDDVAFAKAVVARVKATACIDPRRVYAVGTSMGGGMAYQLACRAADTFAAVAASAFDLLQEQLPTCKPSRAITVVSFRGTADKVVPYEGGPSATVPGMPVTFLGAEDTFARWAQTDQCTGLASSPDGNGCKAHATCQGGVEVVLCTKQGGGQDAPDAAYAWPILKRHTL